MIRRAFILLLLSITSSGDGAELRTDRDIAYVKDGHALQKLDVYAPAHGKNLPVVVWIHGGGWRRGDKGPLQQKPQAFADRGLVTVSVNYRFFPEVSVQEMTADC